MAMSTKKASGRKTTAKSKAASKSSTKAAKKPAKKVPRGAKARWKLFREKLDRAFGPIVMPETETVLEKAAALVLREQGTELTTSKALESLREDFVDWNEVRLSRPSELARLMTGTSKVATTIHANGALKNRLFVCVTRVIGSPFESEERCVERTKP